MVSLPALPWNTSPLVPPWVVPSAEVREHAASPDEHRPWAVALYRPSADELAPYEDDWDAIEGHLLSLRAPRPG
jgi:hypothetical protein